MEAFGVLGLLVFVLGIVLVVAWIILPFAIIGTKPLLQELIEEVKKTNALLQRERIPIIDALPKEENGFLSPLGTRPQNGAAFRGKSPDR